MNVHLIVPDLFWPDGQAADALAGLDLPALEILVARGRRRRRADAGLEAWLCAQFGVAKQADWPAAPFALAADGGDPGTGYWLRADPVHLRLGTDELRLTDAAPITREQAEGLVEALNRHFADDALTFYPMRPERWYLRLPAAPAIATTPIADARGRSVDPLLPTGDAAKAWHARMNEMQMVLHEHPVNTARESGGLAAVNAVWLWGGGTATDASKRAFARLRSDDPVAAGLVQAAGGAALPSMPTAAAWLAAAGREGVEGILLDGLRGPAAFGDAGAWRERLTALERDWFAPLLNALRAARIGMLTLQAVGAAGTLEVETTRQDLRYFWRRRAPMSAYSNP